MSSDSDNDDCFCMLPRLHSIKNKYSEDKIKTVNLLIAEIQKTDNSWQKNVPSEPEKDSDLSQFSETTEDYSLDAIIAKNSKKGAVRSIKRTASADVSDNVLPDKDPRKKRAKKGDASTSQNTSVNTQSGTNSISEASVTSLDNSVLNTPNEEPVSGSRGKGRGRSRGRGRAKQNAPGRGLGKQSMIPESSDRQSPRARGRGRSKPNLGRGSNMDATTATTEKYPECMYDFEAAVAASVATVSGSGPIYSVGNTDEYPDMSDDQPLFSNFTTPKPISKVVVIEDNDNELDNEELSVKVYWQSAELMKFNIRRFQKLTEIFNHFAELENVSHDKLFFTYNDKILKSDDTPDSINYSIVKFIDGGIINQSISSIVKNDSKGEIKLKFQCQNIKKPLILSLKPDDKMSVVMGKCAEHLGKPLDKLKFHFDGDLISDNHTPRELELDGDECIDVRTIS